MISYRVVEGQSWWSKKPRVAAGSLQKDDSEYRVVEGQSWWSKKPRVVAGTHKRTILSTGSWKVKVDGLKGRV